jgi:excisionase family DNA binding protein
VTAPISLTIEQAAQAANVGRDTIRRAVKSGRLRAKRTGANGGGKHLISIKALQEWFDSLEDA